MGIHADVKNYLKKHYSRSFTKRNPHTNTIVDTLKKGQKTDDNDVTLGPRFQPDDGIKKCEVVIVDAMRFVKGLSTKKIIKSGSQFVKNNMMTDAASYWRMGAETVVYTFDRTPAPNKDAEQRERTKGKEVIQLSDYYDEETKSTIMAVTDDSFPDNVADFVSNRVLIKQILQYFTEVCMDPLKRANILKIPKGKNLYVFGCPTQPIQIDPLKKNIYEYDVRDTSILHVTSDDCQVYHNGPGNKNTAAKKKGTASSQNDIKDIPSRVLKNLLEGEIACFFFVNYFVGKNILVVSGDGDTLLIALEALKTRSQTNSFYVRLTLPQGGCEDININWLYNDICNDKNLKDFVDPVSTLLLGFITMKNDYIQKYTPSIKTLKYKEEKTPATLAVLFTFSKVYSKLIVVTPNEKYSSLEPTSARLNVKLDEELFIQMTRMCYVLKYEKKLKQDSSMTMDMQIDYIEAYLSQPKLSFKKRMTDIMACRVFARQMLWLFIYWSNGYRADCNVPSPIMLHECLPYFGWMMNSRNECLPAIGVSRPIAFEDCDFLLTYPKVLIIPNDRRGAFYNLGEWENFYNDLKDIRFAGWNNNRKRKLDDSMEITT